MSTHVNCPHCGKGLALVQVPDANSSGPEPTTDVPVDPHKLVTCNRCGEEGLAWAQSKKGTFYLCRTEKDTRTGLIYPLRKEFH